MHKYLTAILMLASLTLFSQSEEGIRVLSAKCAIQQTGSGSGFWQVGITNFNDPGGQVEASEIDTGDVIQFSDAGNVFALEVTGLISAVGTSATVKVSNVGITGISSVPTTNNAFWSRRTVNFGLTPRMANISANDDQLQQEYMVYRVDSLLGLITAPLPYSASQGIIDSFSYFQLGNPTSVTNSADRFLRDRYIALNGKKLNIGDATNTILQLDGTTSGNRVGMFTTAPSVDVGLGAESGISTRTIRLERRTTANLSGANLLIQAGGATSGSTNRDGGNLLLYTGESTGDGTSGGGGGGNIIFGTSALGGSGTSDNFVLTKMLLQNNGNLGIRANFAGSLDETLVLGSAFEHTGTMSMSGSGGGKVIIKPADVAGTWTMTIPVNDGSAGQSLVTDGSGVTSWAYAGVNPSLSPAWSPTVTSNTTDTLVAVRYSSFSVTDSTVSFQVNFEISPTLGGGIPSNLVTSYGFSPPITKDFTTLYDVGVTATCPQINGVTGGLAAVAALGYSDSSDDKVYITVTNTAVDIGSSGGNFLVSVNGQYRL